MKFLFTALLIYSSIVFASEPCLYNPKSGFYQTCYHVTAGGECVHFGENCVIDQEQLCYLNFDTGTYHECFHVTADGKCVHFGAPCY